MWYLCMHNHGLPLLLQLEESSLARHAGERKIRTTEDDDDVASIADSMATEVTMETNSDNEQSEDSDSDGEGDNEGQSGGIGAIIEESVEDNGDDNNDDVGGDGGSGDLDKDDVEEEVKYENRDNSESSDNVCDRGQQESGSLPCHKGDSQGAGQTETAKVKTESKVPVVEFPDTEISLQHVKGDK